MHSCQPIRNIFFAVSIVIFIILKASEEVISRNCSAALNELNPYLCKLGGVIESHAPWGWSSLARYFCRDLKKTGGVSIMIECTNYTKTYSRDMYSTIR